MAKLKREAVIIVAMFHNQYFMIIKNIELYFTLYDFIRLYWVELQGKMLLSIYGSANLLEISLQSMCLKCFK